MAPIGISKPMDGLCGGKLLTLALRGHTVGNMLNLETWIGLRYLKTKKRNGFMSFISVISIIGIALGVITLIVVLSVMNGFQKDVREQLYRVAPHMETGLLDRFGEHADDAREHLDSMVRGFPELKGHVVATMPFVAEQVLLTHQGTVRGIILQGVDPEVYPEIADMSEKVMGPDYSTLSDGSFNIILGEELAKALGVHKGEKINILSTEGNITPTGMIPRIKQFTVSDILKSQIYDISANTALINIGDAQKFFRYGDTITGLRVRLNNPDQAPEIRSEIVRRMSQDPKYANVWLYDWSEQNKSYFSAVAMEKKIMFIIMTLISAVACFNLVSSLVMTVNEKEADIAILRTLGLSPGGIMKIFIIQGAIAGFIGTLAGVVIGVLIALNVTPIVHGIETLMGHKMVESQVYFLNYIPSDVHFSDVAIIASISLILAFLATLYPSWKAARTEPAKALSYE